MARGGKRAGAGRKPNVPNKITSVAREVFLATFQRLAPDLEGWIRETADGVERPLVVKGIPIMAEDGKTTIMVRENADPGRASDLLIRMAEYHFPKLGRTEVTGPDGGPVEYVIRDLAKESK